jgi:hypothetical protein
MRAIDRIRAIRKRAEANLDVPHLAEGERVVAALARFAESAQLLINVNNCPLCKVWWEPGSGGGWRHHFDCSLARLNRDLETPG